MDRVQVLDTAKEVVAERGKSYGAPKENFERIAALWNTVLGDETLKEPLNAADVAMMMICLKLARLTATPDHEDSMVDICGYAALMSEVV